MCARTFARTALILIITFSPGQDSRDIDLQVINIITAVHANGRFGDGVISPV
jgi:hypothetical protein